MVDCCIYNQYLKIENTDSAVFHTDRAGIEGASDRHTKLKRSSTKYIYGDMGIANCKHTYGQ